MRKLDPYSAPQGASSQASLTPLLQGTLGREAGAPFMGAKATPPCQALSVWKSPRETVTVLQGHEEQAPGTCDLWETRIRRGNGCVQAAGLSEVLRYILLFLEFG